jgi:hypothetical protein
VPKDTYLKAFPTILKGAALNYYYTNCKSNPYIISLSDLCDNIKQHFKGAEHEQNVLTKWNDLTLRKEIDKNPRKSIEDCLQLLIQELRVLQLGLEKDLRHEKFFLNKLLTACQDHPACSIACSKPANTTNSLISDLRLSITTYAKVQGNNGQSQYFTDHRYHSNPRQQYKNHQKNDQNQPHRDKMKRCFVCRHQNCWSTRHTQEERDKAKERYRLQFNRQLDRQYEQYVADMEGEEGQDTSPDDDDNIDNEFEALMVGMDYPLESSAFITEIDSIDSSDARNMAINLSNNAMSHILLREQSIFTLDRYGPTRFYGILINTGAAGESTAGYGQYKAYMRLFGKGTVNIDKSKEGAVTATFGIGSTTSIGSTTINTPIRQCEFHIIQANTPFLLGISDMDKKGIILDNIQNRLISSEKPVPIVRQFGHPFLVWGPTVSTYSHLTETELHTLHCCFGHPSALHLTRLLERASHNDNSHHQLLENITKFCSKCQKYTGAPFASNLPFAIMKTLISITQYTLTSYTLTDRHYSTWLMKQPGSKLQDGLRTVFQLYVSGKLCE